MGGNDGSVYIMREVVVNGYSIGYSGSLYQFDSYKKFSSGGMDGDDDINNNDDEHGTHSDNNGQSQGDNIGAGHPGGSSNNSIHNGQNGTFCYGKPYYTEKQFIQKTQSGSWKEGNVYTLGYIGRDSIVTPGVTSVDAEDNWTIAIGIRSVVDQICNKIVALNNAVMSLSYVQAIGRYNSGTGMPLTLNTNSLGLENLTMNIIRNISGDPNPTSLTINLLDLTLLNSLLENRTLTQKAQTLSTALTLGNITLIKVSENTYQIKSDTYDFDMHEWSTEPYRNIATALGFLVSEGISIELDYLQYSLLCPVIFRNFNVVTGILRRHVLGTSSLR